MNDNSIKLSIYTTNDYNNERGGGQIIDYYVFSTDDKYYITEHLRAGTTKYYTCKNLEGLINHINKK